MNFHKFLQYNTDNLRLGWDLLEKVSSHAEYYLLQRFPKDKQKELCNVADRVHMTESVPPNFDLNLVVGRGPGGTLGSIETIDLPSEQLIRAVGNPWQGCNALKCNVGVINLISMLPCFPENVGEFPVQESDLLKDVEYILSEMKNTPSIIAGDFHMDPNHKEINQLIGDYGFKSYLDSYPTFKTNSGKLINLDKMISNADIKVKDIKVHTENTKEISQGHYPITYEISWDSIKDK